MYVHSIIIHCQYQRSSDRAALKVCWTEKVYCWRGLDSLLCYFSFVYATVAQ